MYEALTMAETITDAFYALAGIGVIAFVVGVGFELGRRLVEGRR